MQAFGKAIADVPTCLTKFVVPPFKDQIAQACTVLRRTTLHASAIVFESFFAAQGDSPLGVLLVSWSSSEAELIGHMRKFMGVAKSHSHIFNLDAENIERVPMSTMNLFFQLSPGLAETRYGDGDGDAPTLTPALAKDFIGAVRAMMDEKEIVLASYPENDLGKRLNDWVQALPGETFGQSVMKVVVSEMDASGSKIAAFFQDTVKFHDASKEQMKRISSCSLDNIEDALKAMETCATHIKDSAAIAQCLFLKRHAKLAIACSSLDLSWSTSASNEALSISEQWVSEVSKTRIALAEFAKFAAETDLAQLCSSGAGLCHLPTLDSIFDAMQADKKRDKSIEQSMTILQGIYKTWNGTMQQLSDNITKWCPNWQPMREELLSSREVQLMLLKNPDYKFIGQGVEMLRQIIQLVKRLHGDSCGPIAPYRPPSRRRSQLAMTVWKLSL